MRHSRLIPALALAVVGCSDPIDPEARSGRTPELGAMAVNLRLDTLELGLEQPLFVAAAPGDRRRLFIVEKTGRIRVRARGVLRGAPFLDLSGQVATHSEQGLLGLAFHPDYAVNGRFFVNYTAAGGGATRVVEYRRSAISPNLADAATARLLLEVEQPAPNHNGGMMAFGPDGYLYIAFGDGGGGNGHNAQDLGTVLGKLIRIDVDGAEPYAVPPDNPFVGVPGARPEIWHLGLRNPWRFSFDRKTGAMYIGDVGQNAWEEVDIVWARGGLNFGWPIMEGPACYPEAPCDSSGLRMPDHWYANVDGGSCAVTGGYVYRGRAIPELRGTYVFADLCVGGVRSFRRGRANVITELTDWTAQTGDPGRITSFGEDLRGELYLTTIEGGLFRIAAATDS